MRPQKTLGILSASPLLHCSASRSAPFITQQTLRPQYCPIEVPFPKTTGYPARRFTVSAPSQLTPTSSSNPTFSYRIAASFSAKGRRFNPKKHIFTFNTETHISAGQDVYTGRPDSGQDAFFVSRAGNSSNVAFGVADGVGGWADQGVDSAEFSHGLCLAMAKVAGELHSPEKKDLWPQFILSNAYQEIVQEGKVRAGGSTACIATGDEEGNLKVAK